MHNHPHFTREDLTGLRPRFDSFVGIDSDGCIFPTMEIKQKQCFHSLIISMWHLESIAQAVRATAEFVNLNSIYRGQNRFLSLLRTFDLLTRHPAVMAAGAVPPPTDALRSFCESGLPLGNPALQEQVDKTGDPELRRVLDWSLEVNREVERKVRNIKPFRWVMESLEDIRRHSDAICVSQTPTEALVREWEEHNLLPYVSVIAGQELGTKAEHLTLATRGRYAADRVLMIGDAPGDRKAALAVGARFFPINPGHEDASWERFHREAYNRFLTGRYDDAYENDLIRQFDSLLPSQPSWIRP